VPASRSPDIALPQTVSAVCEHAVTSNTPSQTVHLVHSRSSVAVGCDDSNSDAAHVLSASQIRSRVAVGAAD
jgi:hypothetical protein